MLSLTHDDMPNFKYASSEEVRGAQEKALNLWVGAFSPLWAPFWLASSVGIGLWAMGQGFKRAHKAIGAVPDSVGLLTSATPSPTDVAGTVQNMVDDGVIAPIQAASKAMQDMTDAVTPSPQAIADQIKAAGDDATAQAAALGQAATSTVDEATTQAVEQSAAQLDAVADIAEDTGSLVTESAPALIPAAQDAGKAATAMAADTAVAVADSATPTMRKPKRP